MYDLIERTDNLEEKHKLMKDNQTIVQLITGENISFNDIKREYELI